MKHTKINEDLEMFELENAGEIEAVKNHISAELGGSRAPGKCATCPGDATEFKDELSRREYGITGMCQRCQDEVFSTCEEGPNT